MDATREQSVQRQPAAPARGLRGRISDQAAQVAAVIVTVVTFGALGMALDLSFKSAGVGQ